MEMLYVITAICAVIVIGSSTYLPIPLLSYKKKGQKMKGRVNEIKKLEIAITELKIIVQEEVGEVMMPEKTKIFSSVEKYVYLYSWRDIPKIDDLVEVETFKRYYRLRRGSLNWINRWWTFPAYDIGSGPM